MLPAPISPTWRFNSDGAASLRPGRRLLQQLLHAGKALSARLLGRAGSAPVCFERDGVVVAIGPERAERTRPIDDAAAHRHPFPFEVGLPRGVFAVHVSDASLRNRRVAAGKRQFVAVPRVARITGAMQRSVGSGGNKTT